MKFIYFIHEIINDYSRYRILKNSQNIFKKNKITLNIDDIDNLPIIEREVPDETTEILQIAHADKKVYTNI